jgi:hypothetical protein
VSRAIGLTSATETTVYRAVGRYTVDGVEKLIYAGLYDTPGAARQRVTWWRKHPGYRGPAEGRADAEVSFVDAWVEPGTVTNHPGVRYGDDWHAPEDRLRAISAIASASEDGPGDDPWKVAYAIRRLADGDFTVAQAREWLGEGWESL